MEGKTNMANDAEVNGADEKFFVNLETNVEEMRAETVSGAEIEEKLEQKVVAGRDDMVQKAVENRDNVVRKVAENRDDMARKVAVSEERARELLREETQKVSQSFKGMSAKRTKAIIGVITVAVLLCVAGLAFVLIMSRMR